MPSSLMMLPSLKSRTSSSEVPRVLLGHEGHEADDEEEELLMMSARETQLLLQP